jgi:peroxiredoxin
LSQAEKAGVEIVAVSPDPNARSHEMAQRLHLGYHFVADPDLAVTRRYGLVHARGGQQGEDVPIPTTVVLDRDGVVRWLWISNNFQVRPDPHEVLRAVRAL